MITDGGSNAARCMHTTMEEVIMEVKDLMLKRENAWEIFGKEKKEEIYSFARDYCAFLDAAKTERECVTTAAAILEEKGFRPLDTMDKVVPGDKVYKDIRGKGLVAAVIGQKPMAEGLNILGAHIDSPRIDLKPMPLFEDSDMAFFKTHYYGGIKKYQWSTIPMAIHGVIYNQEGEKIKLAIGEKEDDPVFTINEILIHLSQEQMTRKANEAVKAEEMNVLIGSIPMDKADEEKIKETVKAAVLQYLYDTYKITEKDFISAELEMVPAHKAKDIGFDRSMVGAYGQDDRVCAYTALRALMDMEAPEKTCVCLLSDKEEVGSGGNTGAQSRSYENAIRKIMAKLYGHCDEYEYCLCIENSKMLSSDVAAAFEPAYPSAYEKNNTAFAGKGVSLIKYTGSRGKSGASDANCEFFHEVAKTFDDHHIVWQTGELGRVDLGGGGTIAVYMANLGMQVIDCGVPVLSMHAPFEVTSKVDIYSTYDGFRVFLENIK